MRAPKPTLLVHNAVDSCCFRAPLVKPYIFDKTGPFFDLFGAQGALQWHENFDPGTHNYQLDNRLQAYQFFTTQFHLPPATSELFSDDEVRPAQDLAVALPPDNLTILDLARKLAASIRREPIPELPAQRKEWVSMERQKLRSIIRYEPVSTEQALRSGNGLGLDFHFVAYQFGFSNGLGAAGILLQEKSAPPGEPAVIVLNDDGYQAAAAQTANHVDRGEQVLSANLLFLDRAARGSSDAADGPCLPMERDRVLWVWRSPN